jgi:branched-chain amino acid transport system ATP-binding protein
MTDTSGRLLLEVDGLNVSYRGAVAVSDTSIALPSGSIRSIIGVNGAGKSSTLRAIAGLVARDGGRVLFDGRDIGGWSVDRIVATGIAFVPEQRRLFASMSVLENLRLGAYRWSRGDNWHEELDRVFAYLPEIKDRIGARAGDLSGGQQQMVAIGRALMSRPTLLMLDEPCTGLAPLVIDRVSAMIEQICADGFAVLLVEQNAQVGLRLSEYSYVMETGSIVLEGPSDELAASKHVQDVYLGV